MHTHTLHINLFVLNKTFHFRVMENKQEDHFSLSDEDRLIAADTLAADTKTAGGAIPKQSNRGQRHKIMDANRLRAQSLNDISRLTQTQLPFSFGNPLIGATTSSTLNGNPNMNAIGAGTSTASFTPLPVNVNSTDTSVPVELSGTGNSAQTVKQLAKNLISNAGPTANFGAIQLGTSTAAEQPATLNDIRQIVTANGELNGAPVNSTQNKNFRPQLNTAKLPNDDVPRKRHRRGGKKYKEKMAKRAEREKNGQNNTTVSNTTNANLQSSNQNASNMPNVSNANKFRQNLQGGKSGKRSRTSGGTPPDTIHHNKKQMQTHATSTPTTSTAKPSVAKVVVESNLVVAVYDSPAPGIILPMDKVKYNKLYVAITNTIFSDMESCSVIPTFGENKHVRGVMKVTCSTPGSKSWLFGAVDRIDALWPNMNLKVVEFNKLPKQTRVLGLFPNCTLNAEQIRQMLSAMNPHIHVGSWTILSSKSTDKGVHIAFGIDRLQLDMLSACRFKLHFGIGFALFKDISKKEGGPQQDATTEAEMDIRLTDLETADDDDDDDINNVTTANSSVAANGTNAQNTMSSGAGAPVAPTAANTVTNTNITMQNQQISANDVNNSVSPMDIGDPNQHGANA